MPNRKPHEQYSIRLIDRIRAGSLIPHGANFVDPGHWAACEAQLKDDIGRMPRIVADNIDEFEYFHWRAPGKREQPGLDPKDIPNLVPPFPVFWVEWKWYDPQIRAAGLSMSGALVGARELAPEERQTPAERFGFCAMPITLRRNQLYCSVWNAVAIADEAGNMTRAHAEISAMARGIVDEEAERGDYRMGAMAHLTNVLIAISFLNCRNVHLIDAPGPPRPLAQSHFRRTGKWLSRHSNIVITPMCRIMARAQTQADAAGGSHRSLHIMRGHFKRYAEGKGLFGKLHGTYFWGSHARGSMEHGEVKSEITVNLKGVPR